MKRIKVSFDAWIQLLGMIGVLGGLIFVGQEMRQSQEIAISATHQARSQVLIDMINTFSEGSEKFHTTMLAFEPGVILENDTLSSNAIYQFWLLNENDFLQYQLGLMEEDIWEAKFRGMQRTYNACLFRPETNMILNFVSAEFSNHIRQSTIDQCDAE
ncbi:MAG: hypothetical protein ACJZ8R_00035 [Pseudohongiellaceae bacterium]|jgi:hypothetical protein